MRDTILIVDDIEANRLILCDMLEGDYDTVQAENGVEAVSMLFAGTVRPSCILLDIMMPEMDGFEVLELIKTNPITTKIPVLFISAANRGVSEDRGLAMGAVDYIEKPFTPDIVRKRVINQVKLFNYSENLEQMVQEKVEQLVKEKEHTLEVVANLVEARDNESGLHIKRTKDFTKMILDYMHEHPIDGRYIPEADIPIIVRAVTLHDVGKIRVPDAVLTKPGRLDDEEFKKMKSHAPEGAKIIKNGIFTTHEETDRKYLQYCYDIARHHHERWDGRGYPDGLAGDKIPIAARIVAIVDVYDALVSPRVYKPSMTHEDAMNIIFEGAGTQFDPELVMKVVLNIHQGFEDINKQQIAAGLFKSEIFD